VSWLGFLLVVIATGVNAASNLLQRAANREEPPELSMRPRLILDLVRRPLWLAGFASVIASFVLMSAALTFGRLAAIQPCVVLELPLTLVGAAKIGGSRLTRREWLAVIAMTAGVAGLIATLDPSGGTPGAAPVKDWLIAGTATVAVIVVVTIVGLRSQDSGRPALLGLATGVTFGLTAACMKAMTAHFHHGLVSVLTAGPTYAMVAGGLAGMYLLQNALHAGPLVSAQPGITLADPATAMLWGIFVFDETTRGGADVVLTVVFGAVVVGATFVLARSQLLADVKGDPQPARM
jgi:hypothetical protein